jgi:hypothetical protein
MLRRLREMFGADRTNDRAAADDAGSPQKETNVMSNGEFHNGNEARSENTANVVELLTSILDQVKRQQSQTQLTEPLEGDASRAVEIFREIDAALDVGPVDPVTGLRRRPRQGRG